MDIKAAYERFIGQEVLIYTVNTGTATGSLVDCVLLEIGDGWVRAVQGEDEEANESIFNMDNIVRIREYPRKKNGKKKLIIE